MGLVAHEQMMRLRAKRQQLKPKNRRMSAIRNQLETALHNCR
jgi:hypothetical protein